MTQNASLPPIGLDARGFQRSTTLTLRSHYIMPKSDCLQNAEKKTLAETSSFYQ